MAITDLTGYTWVGNETIDITTMVDRVTTRKTFNVNAQRDKGEYGIELYTSLFFSYIKIARAYSFGGISDVEDVLYHGFVWSYEPPLGRELTFTGGTDTTNTELIAWLEANGTLTKPAITQLAPFLTSIANAIRKKKGTTAQINAQDFAKEIESIESGGGGGSE